jgi:uncharacterized protein
MKLILAKVKGASIALVRLAALCMIDLYRVVVSPVMAGMFGPACRFDPTCSQYAHDAIDAHGFVRGVRMALGRLLRCRPGGSFGYDPVPREIATGRHP